MLLVSGNYFSALRVGAIAGRVLAEGDDVAGAAPVAVISEGFWKRRFGGDRAVVGRVVSMNGTQVTIVGVQPPGFTIQQLGATARDVTVPIALDSALFLGSARLAQPTSWWLQIMGRLKPGTTHDQVRGNLEGVFHQTARAGMESYTTALTPEQRALSTNRRAGSAVPRLLVLPGSRGVYDLDNRSRSSAGILAAVVITLLLIVCANVANLLLSRATSRRKEISIRLSMGATRGRLVRQLLTESLLLSTVGGACGIVLGYWARQLLPFGQNAPMDWRVFAFVAAVSAITGMAFGLVPALRATRVDLAGAMKENSRSVSSTRSLLTKGLLVLQVAMSLVLLVGAGLFLRTLQNLRSVDLGFNPTNLLVFRVDPRLNRYDADRATLFYRQVQDALAALPGVKGVSLTRTLLVSGSTSSSSVHVPGGSESSNIHMMSVTPSFFDTMEIPILGGRGFTEHDVKTSPRVVVVNETAARKLYPDTNAVGRRVGFSQETSSEYEIVGVIRDTKYTEIRNAAPPTMYRNFWQESPSAMAFVVRTGGDPTALVDAARAAVRQVDPTLPVTGVSTQADQLEGRFAQERLFATAYSLFGGLALLLAAIGLFGVMSYNVARRTNEIGIRMALGARRLDVIRMVLGESLLLVGVGLAIGVGTALFAGRYVSSVLFGLGAADVATMALAMLLMIAVASLAGFLPARRASRVDPLVALRYE
jgi:predicted permease